ncbi:MAG: alpha/beta hydrolase [Defluviicoccus sp.]
MPEIIFNGTEGRLEGRYHHSRRPGAPVALALHPHPLQGGTMNNRVVFALFHAFQRRGFSVLRFNFRGVGRSQGRFDSGPGELSDAAAALDWMQSVNPGASGCWIAGYSFGAWISMQLMMRRPEISGFLSIAPPAGSLDFTFLAPCPASGLIVHGDRDDVVPIDPVEKLAKKLGSLRTVSVQYRVISGADHFFAGHMPDLVRTIDEYLDRTLTAVA